MKILFASDHAGFELKRELMPVVEALGFEVEDKGPFELKADDDYPDFIAPAAAEVSRDPENSRAIIIGGSGEGEAMVANRFTFVRAAVYYGGNLEIIKLSREHNNANVLSLAARFLKSDEAKEAVTLWLTIPFLGDERHRRRIEKIDTHPELP